MRPETASPANDAANAQHNSLFDDEKNAIKSNGHASDDEKSINKQKARTNGVNGHATTPPPSTEATASTPNGKVGDDEHIANGRPAKRQRRDTTPNNSTRKPKLESPPWKKFNADGPTSFTENGRRKSGRINVAVESPPLKKSPPWKKIAADGPTSFTENGRRKSGRIHTAALEYESPERKKPIRPASRDHRPSSRHLQTPTKDSSKNNDNRTRRNSVRQPANAPKSSPPKASARRAPAESRQPARAARRRSPSPSAQSTRHSTRQRRSSRIESTPAQSGLAGSPKIKLRLTRSGVIPLVHPGQVPKRPKIGANFDDFWQRAPTIPVEEGGFLSTEDDPPLSDAEAVRDAKSILRIERELDPGGLLSEEKCSIFNPQGSQEPPRQYARQDHMNRAAFNFRKLMLAEHQRHRQMAKRLAEACRDEWIRRQPKSKEVLEREERDKWKWRYKIVSRTLLQTWENARLEVNKRRLEVWEAEEQKRVKAALNEAVNLSEQKLQERRAVADSEYPSEDDGFDDMTDEETGLGTDLDNGPGSGTMDSGEEADSDEEDSDNMSSSEDEGEDEDVKDPVDEELTQEQLQAKYAKIPALTDESETPQTESRAADTPIETQTYAQSDTPNVATTEGEDSDESVDMDDDMGSSDEDEDDEDEDMDEEDDDDEDDGSDDGAGGLLGFLGKAELKKLEDHAATQQGEGDDTAMPDAGIPPEDGPEVYEDNDEVSLVMHPDNSELNDGDDSHETDLMNEKTNHSITNGDIHAGEDILSSRQHEIAESEAIGNADDHAAQDVNELEDAAPAGEDAQAVAAEAAEGSDAGPAQVETEAANQTIVEAPETSKEVSRAASVHTPGGHKTEIPSLLRGTLREYQHDGLDWLAGLYANNTNGILADEMGLGKTIQTIALLAHLASYHEVWGPHLVVVPTSVMLNWEMEFKKWCPGFKILAYYGTQEERKRKRQGWNNDDVWNVCITSYQLVLQDQQVFKRRRWHYLILDEAHNIKNFKSQRWQTLLGFNTQARLLLTGTPLQNNLTELWSLLFFLMPAENGVGGFADLQEFHDWFHKPESQILESGREQMDDEAKAIITKLHKVLRPYLLRRLKADVEKQMPGKYEHVEFCRLSKRQRELYDGFLARADTKNTLAGGNYLSIINCLMQLRKVCNHPDLFVDRPIMTSFKMSRSVVADYAFTDKRVSSLLKQPLMSTVDLGFLNMLPTRFEHHSSVVADRVAQLSSQRALSELREAQRVRAQLGAADFDPSTVDSSIAYLESVGRWGRFEELQHCVYLNALRRQQRPIYGKNVVDLLTIGVDQRPHKPRPKISAKLMSWFEEDSTFLRAACPSLIQRADNFKVTIEKFSCVTPAVITRDLEQFILGQRGVQAFTDEDLKLSAPVRWAPFMPKEPPLDPWHEARMRLSIQFPDKRLLQYDCGKLQALDKLLRRLQTGGHRALIFTQMTKVLDILEQFLNIHGHKYLRLDGATKVEQRQILTDRFNHDPRILCFILSTRSGGLGINLTGADTVIFYDQDWNPAMDKQCQDRCHRIGQTRDVHIYRLISEHTIEANILRKASQKQMLDDVVIQEGEFTTDHFNKVSVRDVLDEKLENHGEEVSAADAALDRVLGGPDNNTSQRTVGRALEQAEDKEDVTAARAAEKEILADDADFTEKTTSGASTTRQGTPNTKGVLEGGLDEVDIDDDVEEVEREVEMNAYGTKMGNVDDFMLQFLHELLKHTKLELPKDKKKSKKKGKDTRKR